MAEMIKRLSKYFIFLLIFLIAGVSCDKTQESIIPSVTFYFKIDLTKPGNSSLNIPGVSTFIPGVGYGGIIIYCAEQGVHYVYDVTCPYEVSLSCKIESKGSDIVGECPCCKSKFILLGGYPTEGPAPESLRQYKVSETPTTLIISNN